MNIQQEIINAPGPEPVAYIEHHKGGDNLVWDNPGGKYSVLYTVPPAQSEPVAFMTREGLVASRKQVETNTASSLAASFTIPLYTAPQPPKLSDERIFDLLKQVDPHAVRLPLGFKQFAIAIEREILGGGHE